MGSEGKKVLIVDEAKSIEAIRFFLKNKEFTVFGAANERSAFDVFERENIALILLNPTLPDMDGESFCKMLRRKSHIPIIMLAANIKEADILKGLEAGADDCIVRPFSLEELYARVKAMLRRAMDYFVVTGDKAVFNDGDMEIDFKRRSVKRQQHPINLTPREFDILATLVKYPDRVFTRGELIDIVIGNDFSGFIRTIDSHIRNLRVKIEENPKIRYTSLRSTE
jgi:DNA-binding response OmpR family regulator